MSGVRAKGLHQDLAVIFGGGAAAALSDGQLLDRFLGPADEASEQAFEALVRRHGPMVLRVCHQVLGDSHDADDAFQAVFLILARTGCSVLQRESVASWLYGVALRVAARARKGLIKRRRVEQLADDDLDAVEAPILESAVRWNESAEIIHQEVSRLAEKYRAPIVLCYLEGLTHDQAAARLNWPVGTVRSRLSRGRDRLRGRLSRRELLDAARQRLEAQRAYYEEGRITIDRFITGSQRLMEIERLLSQTKEEALAAIQRHVDLLKEIEAREQGELTVGKGTVANVAEAHQNRLEAEVLLKHFKMPEKPNPVLSSLERRLSELERKLNLLLNQGDGERRRR